MADCIECLAPLADGEWSVHANRGKCMANLQAAARAMSLRIADLEAKLAIHADASRRASVLWCEAHPDAPTYPDGVDLMVWLMAQLADAEAMRRETVALCERVDEARPLGGDVVAVLDAIRAVPVEELHAAAGDAIRRVLDDGGADFAKMAEARTTAIRAHLLAAGEAAARGDAVAEDGAAIEYKGCRSCRGYGHIKANGKPSVDRRDRACLDCGGEGRVPAATAAAEGRR